MSETSDVKGTDAPGQHGVPGQPTDAELASMSREELVALGGKLDGVDTVFKEDRWPVEGTKAEKRAERSVANWLLLGGLSGLALLLVFLFWPWEYKGGEDPGHWWYDLATPLDRKSTRLNSSHVEISYAVFCLKKKKKKEKTQKKKKKKEKKKNKKKKKDIMIKKET